MISVYACEDPGNRYRPTSQKMLTVYMFLFLYFQVMTDDDDYTAMPAGFPKFENDDGKKKFVFRIPKFSKNVLVDPSVTPGKKSSAGQKSAASWLKVNFTFALLLQVAAMFAAQ